MTLLTITFDDEQWQVVPKVPVPAMIESGANEVIAPIATAGARASAVYIAMLAAAPEPQVCFCDEKGIGDPAKSCGDCPRDYGMPTVRANPEPPAQQPTDEHTDMLRELLASYGNSGFSAERAALTAAIEALEPPAQQPHPDDAAVDAFAAAMKSKLAEARAKGRGGWQDKGECSQEYLSTLLRDHVSKGDPRDVANFCCFLWNRGEGIAESPAQQPMTEEEAKALIPTVLRSVPVGNLPQVSTGYLIAMMRAVERHHGIGKGESNAG